MILLDTHVWVWWTHGDDHLSARQAATISQNSQQEIGISIMSCWEIAKLVEYGRLRLPCSLSEWFDEAFAYPGLVLVPLSPEIILDSVQLPGKFHRDPADQLIVATARVYGCRLLSSDSKIIGYPHVEVVS